MSRVHSAAIVKHGSLLLCIMSPPRQRGAFPRPTGMRRHHFSVVSVVRASRATATTTTTTTTTIPRSSLSRNGPVSRDKTPLGVDCLFRPPYSEATECMTPTVHTAGRLCLIALPSLPSIPAIHCYRAQGPLSLRGERLLDGGLGLQFGPPNRRPPVQQTLRR